MTVKEFLDYATGPGISAIVGFIVAFILEWMPAFTSLSAKGKRGLTMGLSFAVPVAATFLIWVYSGWPIDGKAIAEGLFGAVFMGFSAFYASQGAHGLMME
ncbi:MAG: hypothetical protein PVJ86_00420 [Phycisphaerales bacterium]|jgi:hypothetical protein